MILIRTNKNTICIKVKNRRRNKKIKRKIKNKRIR
jgi:hypothetical protein